MRKNNIAYFFVAPSVIVTLILVLYPLVTGIYLSFTNADQYNTFRRIGQNTIPATYEVVGFQNFEDIFTKDIYLFWQVFRQTIVWTTFNVVPHILIGLGLAMLLNRDIKGRGIYRMLLIVPWAIPSYISAFVWRFMFNGDYGFMNNLLVDIGLDPVRWLSDGNWAMFAVIVANTWLAIPFNMLVMLGGLQSIPIELYEAAEVDGANWWEKFTGVTLPLLRPVMMTATLLGVIWTFNAFNIIYLVSEGGPSRKTEILATWAWRLGFDQRRFGIAAAYSVVILLILLLFSGVYIRAMSRSGEGEL